MTEDPPADRLLQMYFAGMKWWSPPGDADDDDDADPGFWECPYPDVTE